MKNELATRRTVIAAGALLTSASAVTKTAAAEVPQVDKPWTPVHEPQDAWLEKPGTRHRLMFDTTTPAAAEAAMFYANTYYDENKKGYGLTPETLGVAIVLRHLSTAFGYNDQIWIKYGTALARILRLDQEQAAEAANGNPLIPSTKASANGGDEAEPAVTLNTLAAKGTRFAVCAVGTIVVAAQIAEIGRLSTKAVAGELRANLIMGAVLVPAGIVAVNRAQEHGYAYVSLAG